MDALSDNGKMTLNLKGYTLILPSVSVGNVGQLSADLLISTLGLKRVGRFFDASFVPLVGADPYDETTQDICTAVDYYASEEKKLIVLQIRSPLVKRPSKFFHDLCDFIKYNEIAKVIILTSSFGHEKRDEQIRTAPFRYLTTEDVLEKYGYQFKNMSWISLEPKVIDEFSGETDLQIHGGGFAKTLFQFLIKDIPDIQCVILLKFCFEGDNIPDAIELTNYLNQWLKLIPVDDENACKLKFPPSWKYLFGNSPPRELY